jgi:parallel beta-helix repeat protein
MKRIVSGIALMLLLVAVVSLSFNIKPIKSAWTGTVYILADGSINPPDAPIITYDKVTYTLTGHITSSADGIVVERDNVIIDGAGYWLEGDKGCYDGIKLVNITNVTIKNISIKKFWSGIEIYSSYNNIIIKNNITNNQYGIFLFNSLNNTIRENSIANDRTFVGVWLRNSNSNAIYSNNITGISSSGIMMTDDSSFNNVYKNSINIRGNYETPALWIGGNCNNISGNIITSKNGWGVWLDGENNKLRNNIMTNSLFNFAVGEWDPVGFVNDVDASNKVNGKPIYYWVNEQEKSVPPDAGFVALINCENIIVKNLNITNNGEAILVANSQNITITQNTLRLNHCGVFIENSSRTIMHSNIMTDNRRGIMLFYSSGNMIYHNNLINNDVQVRTRGCTNIWDDGYPSGGNYWSDYKGKDEKSGLNQDILGRDGIGDTPYVIDEYNQDRYPLMVPRRKVEIEVISLAADKYNLVLDEQVTLRWTIKNTGNDKAYYVKEVLEVPSQGLEPSELVFPVGDLDPGQTHSTECTLQAKKSGNHEATLRVKWKDAQGNMYITEASIMISVGIPTANGEIVDIGITKNVFKIGELVTFTAKIKNTGSIGSDFWIRYALDHPGSASWPKKTFFRSPAFHTHLGVNQFYRFDLAWIVPEEASAGVYNLKITLYAEDPDKNPTAPVLDIESVYFAFIVDQDVSYVQVLDIPAFLGQKRAVFVHIAKRDVEKSGVLTFKVFVSMVQLASLIGEATLAGTSALDMFALGIKSMITWGEIEKRNVQLRQDDKSFDFLEIQVIGRGALAYEDASPLDIDLSIGLPALPKIPLCLTMIQEQYLQFECPYFAEIQFEWSILTYLPQMEEYFPYFKFSKNEQWYPCHFYFDNNADVSDNKDNYRKPEFSDPKTGRPPYYVFIHVEEDAKYLTIQYWLYYVYNGLYKLHMHDWDSSVYIIFDRNNLEIPKKVGFCYHWFGYTVEWESPKLQKVGNHPIVYVAEGSHGAYHQLRWVWDPIIEDYLFKFDVWYAGGITLGYENLTNWIIARECMGETTLPGLGSKLFCRVEHMTHNCVEPVPSVAVKEEIIYWPKDFSSECKAAWHQDKKWKSTEPPPFALFVAVKSPVNLCVEDSMGRRTGVDEHGNVLNEIPYSLYSGPESEPEVVAILDPTGEYIAHVYGVSEGTFDFESWIYLNGAVSSVCNFTRVIIEKDQRKDYIISEFPYSTILSLVMILSMLAIALTKRMFMSK